MAKIRIIKAIDDFKVGDIVEVDKGRANYWVRTKVAEVYAEDRCKHAPPTAESVKKIMAESEIKKTPTKTPTKKANHKKWNSK